MNIKGLEVNSPEYWEIRHQREDWPRCSSWAMDIVFEVLPRNADVLIVGCGQGMEAVKLIEHRPDFKSIVAIDISPIAIEKAKARAVGIAGPQGKIAHFVVADVFDLKSLKHTYDFIISIQNFEHWRHELQTVALHQLWKKLRPGGQFFFTGIGRSWSLDLMNYSPMEYNGEIIETPNDYHYNNWNEQDVYNLFICDAIKANNVRFYRRRGRDRVIAVATK